MNKPMTFAIVVPVYNVEKYLRECLESIRNQTYPYFEVFMVDDGSTDSSGKICDEYVQQDKRYHVIHQLNRGLSAARNTALNEIKKLDKFDFVSFIDSDDWVDKVWLRTLVSNISSITDLIIFGFQKVFLDTLVSRVKREEIYYLSNQEIVRHLFALTPYEQKRAAGALICTKVVSKKLLSYIQFDDNLPLLEDVDFLLRASMYAKNAIVISDKFYFYRQRKSSLSNEKLHITTEKIYQIYLFLFKKTLELQLPEVYREGLWNFMYEHLRRVSVMYLYSDNQIPSELQKNARFLLPYLYKAPHSKILWMLAYCPVLYCMYIKYRKYKTTWHNQENFFD